MSEKPQGFEENDHFSERQVHIYRKVARIFHEKGYDATSMSDLADALGLTKAGLYHYIEGKQDLLFRVINFALDWIDREVIAPARAVKDPEERLRLIIQLHGGKLLERARDMSSLPDEVRSLTPKNRRHVEARMQKYFDVVSGAIDDLKRQGRALEVNSTVATFGFFGMLLWMPRWHDPEGPLSSDEILGELSKLFFGGLLAAKSR